MRHIVRPFILLACLLLTLPAHAATTQDQINAVNQRIEQLNADIKTANQNRDKAGAQALREQRSAAQAELRDLKQQLREEKRAGEKQAKRAAAEAEWETYPADKKLCTAVQYNRFDLVKKVVESGTLDLQQPSQACFFPLGDAAARGFADITEYLLQKGAPKTARAPVMNALISAMDSAAASSEDRTAVLDVLKRHGATLYDSAEQSLPGGVVAQGDDVAREKLEQDYNVTADQLSMGNSFTKALEKGHINNIRWLLANGAKVEDSMLGRTALMIAVDSNDPDKVKLLVESGADVNRRGLNHASVLAHAERRLAKVGGRKKAGMETIVAYLKARGATRSDKDRP